jgi:outer membrane protein
MKRILFVLAMVLCLPCAVAAQGLKIGYINSQSILADAPGAKEAQAQFDTDMQSYKAEVQQMATELENLVKQYETQQAMLSPAAKQTREADIRGKQQAYQERLAAIDQRAAQRQQELVQPVMDRINQVIEAFRAEQGYSLIFDVSAGGVVAANPTLDLTSEIVRRLQAQAGGTAAAAPAPAPAAAPN